jgi:hypothetical protein
MPQLLDKIGAFLETERKNEFINLLFKIRRDVLNLPCDVSAIDPIHHSAFRHGHKQARHAAIELINELFGEALYPKPAPANQQRIEV